MNTLYGAIVRNTKVGWRTISRNDWIKFLVRKHFRRSSSENQANLFWTTRNQLRHVQISSNYQFCGYSFSRMRYIIFGSVQKTVVEKIGDEGVRMLLRHRSQSVSFIGINLKMSEHSQCVFLFLPVNLSSSNCRMILVSEYGIAYGENFSKLQCIVMVKFFGHHLRTMFVSVWTSLIANVDNCPIYA